MKKLFGTDGIRGAAGAFPLDKKTVEIIGKSLALHLEEKLGRKPDFITGRDTRESGAWLEKAFHRGAKSAGANCESAEIITTPGVAFTTRKFEFDAGIVISASHNPFEDNGIKIFSPSGKKIDEATEKLIERDIFENLEADTAEADSEVDVSNSEKFRDAYLSYLKNEFGLVSLESFKIVVDCANGAAYELAPKLLKELGAEVVAINNQPDGKNINKDCGSLHLEDLQATVKKEKANLGVGFDGDADRALFLDENGELVDGDGTLWIMANYLKRHNQLTNNKVVATVMSNLGLEVALREKNIELLRTAVGDKYVLEELLKTDSEIGGEQSGHIIFPRKSLVGDGMMTTLYLLDALVEMKMSLAQSVSSFRKFPQILVNVRVKEKRPFDEVEEIREAAAKIENQLSDKGRLLLRYSGTENLARVMIEGQEQAAIEAKANLLANVIKNALS